MLLFEVVSDLKGGLDGLQIISPAAENYACIASFAEQRNILALYGSMLR
jgi:hypothetical protein